MDLQFLIQAGNLSVIELSVGYCTYIGNIQGSVTTVITYLCYLNKLETLISAIFKVNSFSINGLFYWPVRSLFGRRYEVCA